MNIDTDTQYAFTRPIVDHMFTNYAGVLKVDGDVGTRSCTTPGLRQGRRGRHGRPHRRGLRRPPLHRHPPHLAPAPGPPSPAEWSLNPLWEPSGVLPATTRRVKRGLG